MKYPTLHILKVWPKYFEALLDGTKMFELRKKDSNFQVGESVRADEWNPVAQRPTGRAATFEISYILHASEIPESFGLVQGYCILGLKWPEVKI
jgi:hypothetical protein